MLMYDLKTASRLYVLEGHKKRLDACTFSPDGRRLVTLCLDDGVVMVWKVGASFSNLFTLPGAPPRQGGASGSDPFKTFPITMPPASKLIDHELLPAVSTNTSGRRSWIQGSY